MSLLELFCDVDDFYNFYLENLAEKQLEPRKKKPGPIAKMSVSEVMTIMILFHQSNYRYFKQFYINYVCKHLSSEFPSLVSYNRILELMEACILPLTVFLNSRYGKNTGIAFIDSTSLRVCHNRRINRNKVFKGLATRGKNSMGWFYGFKLHIVVNDMGELLAVHVTTANTDDRKPVPELVKNINGKLFADKGYISQSLFERLYEDGLELITNIRKNMKNSLMKIEDSLLLRKRFIIETINDQLKNISQIEHSRHRKPLNFAVNLISGLIAYTYQAKKPSINIANKANMMIVL